MYILYMLRMAILSMYNSVQSMCLHINPLEAKTILTSELAETFRKSCMGAQDVPNFFLEFSRRSKWLKMPRS